MPHQCVVLPPLHNGVGPLEIWVITLFHTQTGVNLLHRHLQPMSRFCSEQPKDSPCQGTGQVMVMLKSVVEGGALEISTGVWVCGSMVGGSVYSAFRYWNLLSTMFSGLVRGRVREKARHPLIYPPWHRRSLCSRLANSAKVSN